MRVPQSPKSLRRVMTVSSVRSEDDDGANSSNSSGDETTARSSSSTFKKSRPNESSTRPPRPTYTARYRDGKFTVGVEASLGADDATKNDNNNNVNDAAKNFVDADAAKKLPAAAAGVPLPTSFHRSRERTRISAVQRLVERKLAQKERERLRERELERDRLSHGKARSSSSNGCDNSSSYFRERSWDATYHSSFGGRSFSASGCCKDEEQLHKPRTEKENEYLASLLWRTSRSCSGTRRRVPQSDGEEEVAKTIITIGPGKPTRIREHSPSKRSPTSELPPSSFGAENDEDEDRPTPLKSEHRDQSPSKKSESLFKNSSPLKSTGLFREFAKTTSTPTTTKTTADGKRKTSFTTEKTFQVNIDDKEKARRLSIDCNYVYERSVPTFSTFSQSDDSQPTISSSTSSLTSSFSSTSSADLTNDKEPIRLSRLRPATFAKSPAPEARKTEKVPEPPVRERKTSRRIFISTAFNNKNVSNVDDTSSNVSSSSSNSDDSASAGSDGAGSPFSSASSRLLFNLSSGYRYHRAAAAANSALNGSSNSSNNINNSGTRHININICNKSYNSNDESYPRRRFSQEHLAQEESDTFSGESVFVTRPVRQPVRKISLPVRPVREQRREAARWDDFQTMSGKYGEGDGGGSINKSGSGELASPASSLLPLNSWSKYKLCDDSLFYPGCCVEHDRLSLVEKSSSMQSSSSSGTNNYNFLTNSYFSDFGDGSDLTRDNHYNCSGVDLKTSSTFFGHSNACSEVTDSSHCSDASTHSGGESSFCNETFFLTGTKPETTKEVLSDKRRLPDFNLESRATVVGVVDDDGDVDDDSSLSTLSGSGIDFFRKLVIHRDQFGDFDSSRSSRASTIKDSDNLIDRFISDTLLANHKTSPTPLNLDEDSAAAASIKETVDSPESEASEATSLSQSFEGEVESQVEVSSISKDSSVSGSGLLYLRNYLKKKKRLLSSVRQKPEAEDEVQRSESSLSSEGSTLADILNETFDSEDSELQKLDWDDFDEDDDVTSYDFTEDDIGDLESILSSLQISDEEKDGASESTPKLYRDTNLDPPELLSRLCGLKITVESPKPESFSSSCSTAKNSPSILSVNPVDALSVGKLDGFRNRNLSGPEREQLIRSMKENEPVKKLILSSPTTFHPKRTDLGPSSEPEAADFCSKDEGPKNRLANFWENRILQKTEVPVNLQTSFRPAMPSYYSPEVQSTANERIRMFLEVTRKAAEAFETSRAMTTATTMTTTSTRITKLKSY